MPSELCSICSKNVTFRQQGLECDHCNDWYHRICCKGTVSFMTQEAYRSLTRSTEEFIWHCPGCAALILSPIVREVSAFYNILYFTCEFL